MARSRWTDVLQDHLFWAMDISGNKQIPVFTPLFGFSGMTAPKIHAEIETFKDGTYNYSRHVVKGGSVPPVTFTRAASMYDSDFYDWIYYAINGTTLAKSAAGRISESIANAIPSTVRRTLLLFHFSRINLASTARSGTAASDQAAINTQAVFAGIALAAGGGITAAAAIGASALGVGPFSFATWMPARAWVLHDCVPVSYSSGSDFNASSGEVSMMTLEVQPEWVEEFSCGI